MQINYTNINRYKTLILSVIKSAEEQEVLSCIDSIIGDAIELNFQEKTTYVAHLKNSILKYDILQPMLDDDTISEIMVNGFDHIFIEKNGKITQQNIQFENNAHLLQLIHKIASEVGREVNYSKPLMDARLKDGSRVNVVLDPVAINGPIVTIRKFKQTYNTLNELITTGMISSLQSDFLKKCIQFKYNLFICGSTGSGKTTLLNCLSSEIPGDERVIVIEDASEIQVKHLNNVIFLETRNTLTHQHPITMADLIKNALRMRPDRIIVGEVRGEEVTDMLQAMSTGHDGSISTGHSNSALDMLVRLEIIASSHSPIPHMLIRRQIISAIDILIFIERQPDGSRRVTEISELVKSKSDYTLNLLFSNFKPSKDLNTLEHIFENMNNKEKLNRYVKQV